ncbi:MAG: Hsp20/alpha crystallin family protein [candidate division NC10 bacterium]|nr:Hsp20/alpha crystallin family protein [candidate division NC10 bacterium]
MTQPWLGPGWDPSGDFAAIQQEMNRLFESLLGQAPGRVQPAERTWAPPMDVCETKTEVQVLVELAGIPLARIQIEIVEGVLTIRGERDPDPAFRQDQLLQLERRYGPFYRSLNLPSIVDPEGVRASYRDGVLEIRLPKRPEATPRVISVEAV